MTTSNLPCRRCKDLTAQSVGEETLIYDESRHKAFCLNAISSAVWNLADGQRTVTQIADAAAIELQRPVMDEVVQFALGELERDGLLESESYSMVVPAVSRRALMKRLGIGAAMMVPVVTAVIAPKAAHAQSSLAQHQ